MHVYAKRRRQWKENERTELLFWNGIGDIREKLDKELSNVKMKLKTVYEVGSLVLLSGLTDISGA